MTCNCKLPIIRGYEPGLYCLNCGLKLKNKTMEKRIKNVIQLKKGFKYLKPEGHFYTSLCQWALIKKDGSWYTSDSELKFSETTIRENPGLFEDVYETERKKICVEIEYDKSEIYEDLEAKDFLPLLTSTGCFKNNNRNIKVTEIKPVTKEDVEWFYNAGWRRPCNNFNSLWAEFQAKKEAENGK